MLGDWLSSKRVERSSDTVQLHCCLVVHVGSFLRVDKRAQRKKLIVVRNTAYPSRAALISVDPKETALW